MIAIITDRLDMLTTVEGGVQVIPPFSTLAGDRYDAAVIAVTHDLRHNARFQAWVENEVRSRLKADSYDYICQVPCGPVERPALEYGQAHFEHVPDGHMVRIKDDEGIVWDYIKVRPMPLAPDLVEAIGHKQDPEDPGVANAVLLAEGYAPHYANIAPDAVVVLDKD